MITPENNSNKPDKDNNEEEQKKTVYIEPSNDSENLDNGETSSVADLGRSEFIRKPSRSNKPLGSSHEPGTTPGRDF